MNTEEETFTSGSLLEWYKALAIQRADQLKRRDETIKELREALGDVMIIIENSPELWLIESQWNIIDKARKLVTE